MDEKELYINFDEYIRQGEPQQKERAEAWRVAIGLQAVDGLKTSEYLQATARRNIEGEITIDEARELVKQYYFRNALVRANYRNVVKGVEREPIFLIRFFRNLLLGEGNMLKNRYMMANPPEEWQMPASTPTSSGQVPEQVPEQVSEQVQDLLHTKNSLVLELIKIIGEEELSIAQLMEKTGLKHRPNFIEYHLNPAMKEGYVRLLYPQSPRHPRQKYLLTVKGLALYNEITKENT